MPTTQTGLAVGVVVVASVGSNHHALLGAEFSKLIEAANRVCERGPAGRGELVLLHRLSVS